MTNKKTPSIRFKGFTDDWEQRKLGDCFLPLQNNTLSRADLSDENGVVMNVHYGDVLIKFEECLDVSKERLPFVKKQSVADKFATSYLKNGDVIVADTAEDETVGKCTEIIGLTDQKVISGLHTIPLRPNGQFATGYLGFYMNSAAYHTQLKPLMQGIKVTSISKSAMQDTVIKYPSDVKEQALIGQYFMNLDHLITLHQRECERLQIVKKSMLENMFPKNGERVPKIRFSGFADDWEQRKLSDLIIEYKETVDSDCTLPVLTSSKTEGVVLQEEHFGSVQNHDITGYNILPRNYCTYRNRSDGVDFTFNINRCCDKGIISKFYPVFYGNNSDIFFISMVLNYCDEVVHEIAYTCTGTGQKVLSFLDLQKMNIRVPSYDEQKKISQYFEQLDNLITLHQSKLEKLRLIKKSMLEQMFV